MVWVEFEKQLRVIIGLDNVFGIFCLHSRVCGGRLSLQARAALRS